MASLVVNGSGSAQVPTVHIVSEPNEVGNSIRPSEPYLLPSHQAHFPTDDVTGQEAISNPDILDKGFLEYGCSHYRRRCRVRAPCCDGVYSCRHCHNEEKNDISIDHKLRHELPRHSIEKVICSLCSTEQEVQQVCINCGVCMGRYFCGVCKLFDDDTSKAQYHCKGCGICRVGGSEKFVHCDKCGCCYSELMRSNHPCVERAMHHDCPICFEYLFDSRIEVIALPCGHTIHKTCFEEMQGHSNRYACPICWKSVCDMSKVWERYDLEIAAQPMSPYFADKMVSILCNDCGSNSDVQYHFLAHKCPNCKSYNTQIIRGFDR